MVRLAACVDHCKPFDFMNRDVLWRKLALCGIPSKLVKMIIGLSFSIYDAVTCDGAISHIPLDTRVLRHVSCPNRFQHLQSTSVTMLKRNEFTGQRCLALPVLVQKNEGACFSLASLAGLAVFLRELDAVSFRRIFDYQWHDYMSNDLVLKGAGLTQVTCIVCERQVLQVFYEYVVRLPAENPAHWFRSCRDLWLDHVDGASTGFTNTSH